MEGTTIIAFFGLIAIFIGGIAFALIAVWMTRNMEKARGAIVLVAFFSPALFATYLLVAAQLRNEFHGARGGAFDDGDFNTLPLPHDYKLWFYDETPWLSSIGKGDLHSFVNPSLNHVQRVAISGDVVFGSVGATDMLDGPADYFFSLDLSTGTLHRFGNEADLRSHFPQLVSLAGPGELFWAAQSREESEFFWPVVAAAPFALFAGTLFFIRRRQKKKPAMESSMTGSRFPGCFP